MLASPWLCLFPDSASPLPSSRARRQVRVPEVEAAPFQPVVLPVGNLFSQPGVGLAIR
jgi:hypothetical protein